jgi:uncharacterized coiled-coil DUF342 family protein
MDIIYKQVDSVHVEVNELKKESREIRNNINQVLYMLANLNNQIEDQKSQQNSFSIGVQKGNSAIRANDLVASTSDLDGLILTENPR